MDTREKRWPLERLVVIGALAFGVAAGGYGIANAASGSSSSSTGERVGPDRGRTAGAALGRPAKRRDAADRIGRWRRSRSSRSASSRARR